MKYYKVICEESCPTCSGSGVLVNPIWREIWKDFDAFKKHHPDTAVFNDAWLAKWSKEKGYWSVDEIGAEEKPCGECEGTGRVRREVSIAEVLAEFGFEKEPKQYLSSLDELAFELTKLGVRFGESS